MSELTNVFSEIAIGLRAKTGLTNTIKPYDMPSVLGTIIPLVEPGDDVTVVTPVAITNTALSSSNDISHLFEDDRFIPPAGTVIYGNKITNMDYTFCGSTALKTGNVTIDNFDAACTMNYAFANNGIGNVVPPVSPNVTSIVGMFANCRIFNREFDYGNFADCSHLFEGCTEYDKGFMFANIVNGSYMFKNCQRLNNITVSDGGNLSLLTDGSHMFEQCRYNNANIFNNFNLDNLVNGANMFANIFDWYSGRVQQANFNLPNLVDGSYMFYNARVNYTYGLDNLVNASIPPPCPTSLSRPSPARTRSASISTCPCSTSTRTS